MKGTDKKPARYFKAAALGALLVWVCGCAVTPEQYIKYYEKNRNRFCKTIERNGVVATVCWVPVEYYAARDMVFDTALSRDSAISRYSRSLFITCAIGSGDFKGGQALLNRGGEAEFGANVNKQQFGHENDFVLIHGSDTVPATAYQYDRDWGIGVGDNFTMVFPAKSCFAAYHLQIRNTAVQLGTVDIPLKSILHASKQLKG